LEGVDLSRNGRISILQIYANASDIIWLIDITVLKELGFHHKDDEGRCLKDILQAKTTKKLFFDVRNDADALFNLYGIDLANTYDLQLLEVAVRRTAKPYVFSKIVSGLGKTLQLYVSPPEEWQRVKDAGVALFAPEKGGSYEVFEKRPLDDLILAYASQDVALLFQLEVALERKLPGVGGWKQRVLKASRARVAEAHSDVYEGQGRHRSKAPRF